MQVGGETAGAFELGVIAVADVAGQLAVHECLQEVEGFTRAAFPLRDRFDGTIDFPSGGEVVESEMRFESWYPARFGPPNSRLRVLGCDEELLKSGLQA